MTVKGNLPEFYLVPIQHPTDVEARSRLIKNRLERLENGHKYLKADQKWPTQKSMSVYLYQQLNAVPEIVVQPPSPQQSSSWEYSSRRPAVARPSTRTLELLLAPSSSPRAEFPFPVTSGPSKRTEELSFLDSSFIYFTFLPIELRLQIWEIELKRPKFIEAQFSSQIYSPTFIGSCTRGSALLSVCRESRELALSMDDIYKYLTPEQRDFGKRCVSIEGFLRDGIRADCFRWSRTPAIPTRAVAEKALPFIPENDTVFFRSLDRPQGGLQSMACSVAGFENIQHLALPLLGSGLPLRNEWKMCLGLFRDLKTLTFLVGGKDQSWLGEEEIELRDVEEWFMDGRSRQVKIDRWLLDVNEVGMFLSGACFEQRMRRSWDEEWEGINVRVVTWRKES
jgi:hypothetical protein